MQTRVESKDVYTIIHISGRLDIDKIAQFRRVCMTSLKGKKVIFSLDKLSFVGSTGIAQFFQTFKDLNDTNEKQCRIVGLNNDFKRVSDLFNLNSISLCESVDMAIASIERPHEFQVQQTVVLPLSETSEVSNLTIIASTETQQESDDSTFSDAVTTSEVALVAGVRNS